MNFYAGLPLLSFIANIILGFYVIFRDPKNKLNRLYAFFTFNLAIWSIGDFFTFIATSPESALNWDKVSTIGSCLNVIFLLHFFFVFTENKFIKKKINIAFLYSPFLFFEFFDLFTDFIAISARPVPWGYIIVPGRFFYFLAFFIITYSLIGVFLCYKFIIETTSVDKKVQAKFLMFGVIIPIIGGGITQVLLPFFNITMIPLTSTLTTATAIIIAYAITKYKLLNVNSAMSADIIIESMDDYVIVVNESKTIILVNNSIAKALGRIKKDLMGKPLSMVLSKSEDLITKFKTNNSIRDYEAKILKQDKEDIIVSINVTAIEDKFKNLLGFVLIMRNIGNTKELIKNLDKNKLELEKSKENLESKVKELNDQRQATLNILEDIFESKEKLESLNLSLKNKSMELESLKSFSDALTGVFDLDEILNMVSRHLKKVIKYSAATFLIFDSTSTHGYVFRTYLEKSVDKNFIISIQNEFEKFINYYLKMREGNFKPIKVLSMPQVIGNKINNKAKYKLAGTFILPLIVGNKLLGAFQVVLSATNKAPEKNSKDFFNAMVATLSVAISRLQTINKIQNSKTETLIQNLNDGVIMFNKEKNIVLINVTAKKITGIKDEREGLTSVYRFLKKDNIKVIINKILKGEIKVINEVEIRKHYYEILIIPIKDYNSKIIGGAIIIHDITHIKEVDRVKTEFVSVASHQLRTPLTAIKLFTEMMLSEEVGKLEAGQKKYLENIYQSTQRMVMLVNDLLSLSRLESGRLKIEPVLIKLPNFIKSIINEVIPVAKTKGVTINFKFNKNLPKIMLDPNLVRQVVHNLITNAVHYSPENKQAIVVVKLDKKDKDFLISISDTGIGISPKAQPRIFEKFFRADNAIKTRTEGTGLGLYVSKMIVESSDGKIWFDSKAGKGTTFYVSLPIKGMKEKKGEKSLA